MPTPKLPKTTARLSTSITIRLIPEDKLGASVLTDPAALTSLALQTKPIGAIESFTEANDRDARPRFEMNADAPGVVKEVYPNLVSMRTLTARRGVLYESDALEAFSIDNGDIVQQSVPFAVVKVEVSPAGSGVADRITIYKGCWFTKNPKSYTLGADLRILQDMVIAYAEREVTSVPKAA